MRLDSGLEPAMVKAQLDRITDSPLFRNSPRLTRFLRFVVFQYLDSGVEEIKEYVVGLEVFDREASFDPGASSVVRVEARRLRSKLGRYYETYGISDDIRIELKSGSYVPCFTRGDAIRQPQHFVAGRIAPG